MNGPLGRFLRRWRQAGAVVVVDPKAAAEWRRVLAERERRRAERAEAAIAELRLAEMAGTLVLRKEVDRLLFTATRVMRDQMLAIAPRLAATLSVVSDPALIEARISDEVRVGLAAFAQQTRAGGYPAASHEQPAGAAGEGV